MPRSFPLYARRKATFFPCPAFSPFPPPSLPSHIYLPYRCKLFESSRSPKERKSLGGKVALIWFSLRCRCLWLELAHADTRGHTHAPRDLRTNSTLSAYTQREFFCLFVCLFNQGRPPVFCFLFFGFFFFPHSFLLFFWRGRDPDRVFG